MIKYYSKKGKTPQETKEKSGKHNSKSVSSIQNACEWFQNLRKGHMAINDAQTSERLAEASNPKTINKIHHQMMVDGSLKVQRRHFIQTRTLLQKRKRALVEHQKLFISINELLQFLFVTCRPPCICF